MAEVTLTVTCITLARIAYDAAKYINGILQGVKGGHNEKIRELADKLKRLGNLLDIAGNAASRIELQNYQQQGHSIPEEFIRNAVDESRQVLHICALELKKFGQPNSHSTIGKVINHWRFEHNGKLTIEKALKDINELLSHFSIALGCTNLHVSFDIRDSVQVGDRPSILDPPELQPCPSGSEQSIASETIKWGDLSSAGGSFSTAPALSPKLILAIRENNTAAVREELKTGIDIMAQDSDGFCALHHTARAGGKRVLREILGSKQFNVDPKRINERDNSGATPLHIAAYRGREGMVMELIQAGADKDAIDNYGRSPLFMAVEGNHEALVELLLDIGAKDSQNLPQRFKEMKNSINLHRSRREKKEAQVARKMAKKKSR